MLEGDGHGFLHLRLAAGVAVLIKPLPDNLEEGIDGLRIGIGAQNQVDHTVGVQHHIGVVELTRPEDGIDRKMSSDTRKKSGQLVVSELIALLQLMPQDLPVEMEGCDCWTDAVGVYEDMTRKRDGAVIWHRVRIKTDHDFVTPKHCLDKVLTRKDLAAADVETGRK